MIGFLFQLFFQLLVASVRLAAILAGLLVMIAVGLLRLVWRGLRQVDWSRVRAASFIGKPSAATPRPPSAPATSDQTANGWLRRIGRRASPPETTPAATVSAPSAPTRPRGPQPLRPPPWSGR